MKVQRRLEVRFVEKRDNRTVNFDLDKLARSIHEALKSAEYPERRLAMEIAGLVHLFLAKENPDGRVASARIAAVINHVFDETDFPVAAKNFNFFSTRRTFIRSQIEVRVKVRQLELFGPDSEVGEKLEPWKKSKIVDSLLKRKFSLADASILAAQVEECVIASGLRTLSRELICELVENKVIEFNNEKRSLKI